MAALTFAISLDRIFDGFGAALLRLGLRQIGREHTMFIAFGTAAVMLLTLSAYGHIPIVFVLATALYFGVFGEIYSLFPATCGDTSARNTQPPTTACSTPRKARPPCSSRSRA